MPRKNPRIMMLLLEFHPIFTGHGIYLQQLIKHLKRYGCEVSILAADFNALPSHEIVDGVEVFRFRFSHGEKYWELKLALRVMKLLFSHRNRYDVLHINGHLDIYGLLTVFNFLTRKHTITQMVLLGADDPMTIMRTYKFMRLRFRVLSLMDRFFCISRKIGESYQSAGLPMDKLVYIPQGVDTDRFVPVISLEAKNILKEAFGLSKYGKIVAFVGAIVERKGVDFLVDAWINVQKRHPEALLLLVGQNTFDENDINRNLLNAFVSGLKKKIAEKALNVYFAGKRSNVNEYLQCSDVFVLPSRNEGFGNVILEGMATGLPVVVTYMEGVSLETVEHGRNGLIVNTVDELSQSISKLLDDTELSVAMGITGREMAVSRFSMGLIAERYAKVYREITGESF